jgi:hypothetical protein
MVQHAVVRRLTDYLVWLLIKASKRYRRSTAIGHNGLDVQQVNSQAAW